MMTTRNQDLKKKKSVREKFGKGYCDKPGIHVNIKLRVNHGNYGYKKYKHKSWKCEINNIKILRLRG